MLQLNGHPQRSESPTLTSEWRRIIIIIIIIISTNYVEIFFVLWLSPMTLLVRVLDREERAETDMQRLPAPWSSSFTHRVTVLSSRSRFVMMLASIVSKCK